MTILSERVGAVSAAGLRAARAAGQPGLSDLLESTGIGYVADGFVRVVDPIRYRDHLPEWFEGGGDLVAFATTALGDLVLARPGDVVVAQLRTGQVVPFRATPASFLSACESPIVRVVGLHAAPYAGLDRPGLEEAWFATPLQPLGGPGRRDTFRLADVRAAWRGAALLLGRAGLPALLTTA